MKSHRVLVGLLAGALIFGPLALWIGGVRAVAFENRPLAPTPDLTQGWSALDGIPGWATDHLPGRKRAVTAVAWTDFHLLRSIPRSARPAPLAPGSGQPAQVPSVVRGKDGYLFFGEDFSRACLPLAKVRRSLATLTRLAEMIEASGRRVVFTVAPNKSSVVTEALPSAAPRADCSVPGINRQNRLLDELDHPLALNLRAGLVREQRAGKATYWKTDTHWNLAGAAHFLAGVQDRFAPDGESRSTLVPGTASTVGDLVKLLGLNHSETTRSVRLTGAGKVHSLPGRPSQLQQQTQYSSVRWRSSPTKGLIPGRTVLVGDSFTSASLDLLQPAIAQGEFLWLGRFGPRQMAKVIAASDTVVLEVVQRYLTTITLTEPGFLEAVETELRKADRKGPARSR